MERVVTPLAMQDVAEWPQDPAAADAEQAGEGRGLSRAQVDSILRSSRGVLLPALEGERLASLRSYQIVDSSPEEPYDHLVRWAAALLDAPMASLTLVESTRQWFKAFVGFPSDSTPRRLSMCSDVVALDVPVVIEDTLSHPRYSDWENVAGSPHVRSYAGVPIVGRDGLPLGALCVADVRPRQVSADDVAQLEALAAQASALLDLRRNESRLGLAARGTPHDRLVAEAHDPRSLRKALGEGQFVPYFQPVVHLTEGRVVGYEALVRWSHPRLGVLGPDRFLPAFEAGDMILPLDVSVLDKALATLGRLQRRPDSAGLHVAVNISGRELAIPGLADRVSAAMACQGASPENLIIEVTETTETDPVVRRGELRRLRDIGVGVLIDDFGSGYANTSALLDTPATGVKIDRSIVNRISHDVRARRVLTSTAATARDLGLDVIAEGVEDLETARVVAECGIQLAQGFAFGPAVPESAL